MAVSAREGKRLYHLTHLGNIGSILERGLLPRSALGAGAFRDTADQGIIAGRSLLGGDLSRFVPFHFIPKTPYDGAVCDNTGSENMAIIAIWRPRYSYDGYYIIPNHPLTANGTSELLPYPEGLAEIRWDLLDTRDYSDLVTKQACMAECDVDHPIPPQDFAFIFVKTEAAEEYVRRLCGDSPLAERVRINPYMFP